MPRWDLKLDQIARDQYRCRACGKGVTVETSHLEHIKPVSTFPSVKAANIEGNLQTLCFLNAVAATFDTLVTS